jgi:hypothetical protein
MPHTTYALFKGIRSHQIVSPSLAGDLGSAPPNACNLCHLDQTLGWTQEHLVKWYGVESVELNEEQRSVSASLEWLLKGNAAYRAIAAWHYGWPPAREASGTGWQAPHVARLLGDSSGVVRYVAARSLRTLPGFDGFEYDFLGGESELEGRSRAAFELWRATRREGDEYRYGRLLMDERGAVRADAVSELMRRRDNRSVTIQE